MLSSAQLPDLFAYAVRQDIVCPFVADSCHGVIAPTPSHPDASLRFGYSARGKCKFGAGNEMISKGIYCGP
jgi:hypothetical protein